MLKGPLLAERLVASSICRLKSATGVVGCAGGGVSRGWWAGAPGEAREPHPARTPSRPRSATRRRRAPRRACGEDAVRREVFCMLYLLWGVPENGEINRAFMFASLQWLSYISNDDTC